jgi:hypothetical protein
VKVGACTGQPCDACSNGLLKHRFAGIVTCESIIASMCWQLPCNHNHLYWVPGHLLEHAEHGQHPCMGALPLVLHSLIGLAWERLTAAYLLHGISCAVHALVYVQMCRRLFLTGLSSQVLCKTFGCMALGMRRVMQRVTQSQKILMTSIGQSCCPVTVPACCHW